LCNDTCNEEVSKKPAEIENKHNEDFKKVFTAIRILMNPANKSNKKINFIRSYAVELRWCKKAE